MPSVESRANSCSHVPLSKSRGHSSCQLSGSLYARAYFWRRAPAAWPNSVGRESCPITTIIPRSALKDPFVGGTPIGNSCSSRPPVRFRVRTNIFACSAISRSGADPAMHSMTCTGLAARRSGSRHCIFQGQGLALSALAPGRSSRRPPRDHRVGRGPLVNNNEP